MILLKEDPPTEMLWFVQERKNREFDETHPLLRTTTLDTWWSEHHCCVSCCRATQKSVSANFRSSSETKNPTKCRLLQLIKPTHTVSVTCVLLEVLLLALGRSVTLLVAPLCAAVLGWGLLAGIIESPCSPSTLSWMLCPTSPCAGPGIREKQGDPPLLGAPVSFVPTRLVWTWLGLVGSPSLKWGLGFWFPCSPFFLLLNWARSHCMLIPPLFSSFWKMSHWQ